MRPSRYRDKQVLTSSGGTLRGGLNTRCGFSHEVVRTPLRLSLPLATDPAERNLTTRSAVHNGTAETQGNGPIPVLLGPQDSFGQLRDFRAGSGMCVGKACWSRVGSDATPTEAKAVANIPSLDIRVRLILCSAVSNCCTSPIRSCQVSRDRRAVSAVLLKSFQLQYHRFAMLSYRTPCSI